MSEIWKNIDADSRIEEIAKRILVEIQDSNNADSADSAFATTISQLADVGYMRRMLRNLKKTCEAPDHEIEKEVVKGLILVTWLQRVYSTIRSLLLGVIAAAVFLPLLLYFGALTFLFNTILAVLVLVFGIVITRLFDRQLVEASKKTVRYLSRHEKLRNFVITHL